MFAGLKAGSRVRLHTIEEGLEILVTITKLTRKKGGKLWYIEEGLTLRPGDHGTIVEANDIERIELLFTEDPSESIKDKLAEERAKLAEERLVASEERARDARENMRMMELYLAKERNEGLGSRAVSQVSAASSMLEDLKNSPQGRLADRQLRLMDPGGAEITERADRLGWLAGQWESDSKKYLELEAKSLIAKFKPSAQSVVQMYFPEAICLLTTLEALQKLGTPWDGVKLLVERLDSIIIGLTDKDILGRYAVYALAMGGAYVVGGLAPLIPYLLVAGALAIGGSIGLTVIALGIVGVVKARAAHRPVLASVLEVVGIGTVAGLRGYALGEWLPRLLGAP